MNDRSTGIHISKYIWIYIHEKQKHHAYDVSLMYEPLKNGKAFKCNSSGLLFLWIAEGYGTLKVKALLWWPDR